MLVLTLAGGGPFTTGTPSAPLLILIVELYMIVLGVITIMLIAARYEAREAARIALSVSQLITGGFVASRVGLIIAEEVLGKITVLWANRAAVSAIDAELAPDGTWSGPLAENALTSITEGIEMMHEDLEAGTTISLVATRIPGDLTRFSAQLVDVGAAIRTAQARHDAERDFAAAHSTLVDLERQRDDFVATTSHELRTPVTSIAGYAELLSESATLTVTERSWVQIIIRNTARLTTLIEDLLTLGRSRVPAPSLELLRLRELAAEVVDIERPMADSRRIQLEIDVDDDAVAHCAADDAGRALGNLISNGEVHPAGRDGAYLDRGARRAHRAHRHRHRPRNVGGESRAGVRPVLPRSRRGAGQHSGHRARARHRAATRRTQRRDRESRIPADGRPYRHPGVRRRRPRRSPPPREGRTPASCIRMRRWCPRWMRCRMLSASCPIWCRS